MKKPIVILPLAVALAALAGLPAANASVDQSPPPNALAADISDHAIKAEPNALFKVGNDLLGLIVTRSADGTIVAQHSSHYSHSSHSSHSSHHSHYSSRY
jgi:hypothetical protein